MNLKIITQSPIYLKYKDFIFPGLSLGISIILVALVVIPQALSLVGSFSVLSDNENKIENLNQKAQVLSQINTEEYREDINTSLLAYPAEKDIPGSISQVLFLVNNSGLELLNIGVSNTAAGGNAKSVSNFQIKLDVEGDVSTVKAFINRFKDSPRVMKVTGLELTGSATGVVQASVSLTTYFQELASNLGDVEAPMSLLDEKDKQTLNNIEQSVKTVPIIDTGSVTGPTGKADPFE